MSIFDERLQASDTSRFTAAACRQEGVALIVAVVFILIFTILGGALYWLVHSQILSTDTERTDVKSFNVSESGIDAGMLTLRLNWPRHSTDNATAAVTGTALKTALQAANPGLWDPKRASPTDFLKVLIYDNVNHATGLTTSVADAAAPKWDSNGDGKMFVDATADVGDDRHRILVLAEKQQWQLSFPATLALWAGVVDSNGQGFQVSIEKGTPPIYYDVHDAQHKGVDPEPASDVKAATPTAWENVVTPQTQAALMKIAQDEHCYFAAETLPYTLDGHTYTTVEAAATAFLLSAHANGKVVYIKNNAAVVISGNKQVGTEEEPVVVVFDTPDGTVNAWDFRGTGDFYGIMLTIGDNELRGTSAMHGAVYCKGTVNNKGNGSCGELLYNQDVINNINGQYVIDVNLVPNTWEEYTTPTS
jgi:hypothetical protein